MHIYCASCAHDCNYTDCIGILKLFLDVTVIEVTKSSNVRTGRLSYSHIICMDGTRK